MNKQRVILLALAAIVVVATALALVRPKTDGSSVVATINGEPVSLDEFKSSMASNRAQVFGYFQAQYNADAGNKSFWTTDFNGEKPLEKIKKDALAAIVKIKMPQILAKHKGIMTDITYGTFLKNLNVENKRRANAVKNNQVIYGPEHYTEAEYYQVVNSNMIGDLKNAIQKEMKVQDGELKQFYEIHKEKLFKTQDSIKIKKISISDANADAVEIMKKIKTEMDKGMDFEVVAANYKEQVKIVDQLFDSRSAHSDSLGYPLLLSKVRSLDLGQVTDVFQENGHYWIAKCMERANGGYRTFEDVKKGIRNDLAGVKYDQSVENLIRSANVMINDKVYDRIGARDIN